MSSRNVPSTMYDSCVMMRTSRGVRCTFWMKNDSIAFTAPSPSKTVLKSSARKRLPSRQPYMSTMRTRTVSISPTATAFLNSGSDNVPAMRALSG